MRKLNFQDVLDTQVSTVPRLRKPKDAQIQRVGFKRDSQWEKQVDIVLWVNCSGLIQHTVTFATYDYITGIKMLYAYSSSSIKFLRRSSELRKATCKEVLM